MLPLPHVNYLAHPNNTIPGDWQAPTHALLNQYRNHLRQGIVLVGAPSLHASAQIVTTSDSKVWLSGVAKRLKSYCDPNVQRYVNVVGMAHPQMSRESVGRYVFVADVGLKEVPASPNSRPSDLRVFINPRLEPVGTETVVDFEVCCSAPGFIVPVKRWRKVAVGAVSLEGKPFYDEWDGLPARIVQHEYDHLRGTLCIDRALAQHARIYYVPPELSAHWKNARRCGEVEHWPLEVPREQWHAMVKREFSFFDFLPV